MCPGERCGLVRDIGALEILGFHAVVGRDRHIVDGGGRVPQTASHAGDNPLEVEASDTAVGTVQRYAVVCPVGLVVNALGH